MGVVDVEVPGVAPTTTSLPPYVARYCQTCAAHLERGRTRSLAVLSSACIAGVLAATGLLFVFGSQQVLLQVCLAALCALIVPALLFFTRHWPSIPHAVAQCAVDPPEFVVRRADYTKLCSQNLDRVHVPIPRGKALFLLPPLLAVSWGSAIQFLGRAEVWVVHTQQDLTLLVDHAVVGLVPASLDESPKAGRREVVLGGRHTFSLVTRSGDVSLEAERAVTPGRSYLLASSPPGQCFFLVRQSYGKAEADGPYPEIVLLPGPGPLWELPRRIDVWFAPLPPPGPRLTSGGTRTALRMLPCKEPPKANQ